MARRRAERARHFCAHLMITECKIVDSHEFDRVARFSKPVVRVVIMGVIMPQEQADGALLWRMDHEIVPPTLVAGADRVALNFIRNPLDEATARAVAAERAVLDAARDRDKALRETAELRRANENLRALLAFRNQLPQHSVAFPKATSRFGWLEVD